MVLLLIPESSDHYGRAATDASSLTVVGTRNCRCDSESGLAGCLTVRRHYRERTARPQECNKSGNTRHRTPTAKRGWNPIQDGFHLCFHKIHYPSPSSLRFLVFPLTQ